MPSFLTTAVISRQLRLGRCCLVASRQLASPRNAQDALHACGRMLREDLQQPGAANDALTAPSHKENGPAAQVGGTEEGDSGEG